MGKNLTLKTRKQLQTEASEKMKLIGRYNRLVTAYTMACEYISYLEKHRVPETEYKTLQEFTAARRVPVEQPSS